jgi:ABC-type nickel/cobalt efflux system permease component RcnA
MMQWLGEVQRAVYGAVGGYLGAFASSQDWSALLTILPLGIVFGAVHALTPGHSKTLLASYLLGSRLALLRGLTVSSVLAATHVVSSVLIALFAMQLLTRTLGNAGRAPLAEDISRGLLVLIGAWFVFRALRGRTHHPRQEGVTVGFVAGLIPCPLTLFVMVTALARGVPAAGLLFAASMFLGIALTLGLVAALAIVARDALTTLMTRHGASIALIARILDGLAGVLLVGLGLRELFR